MAAMTEAGRRCDRFRSKGRNRGSIVVALIAIVGFGFGCTTIHRALRFEEQLAMVADTARIQGQIDVEGGATGTLVVVIGEPGKGEGGRPLGVDSFVRVRAGSYAFLVKPGRYVVGAYEDRNRDGLLDPGELVKTPMGARVLEVAAGETETEDILLTKSDILPELNEPTNVFEIIARTPKEQRQFSLWAWTVQGKLCNDLDDDLFGSETGQRGLWEIMDFVNEGIVGIYFLEEYDPDRIPVLFVHGITGYPQEFSTLIAEIDRERFQPWFYLYPSGFPLDGISEHLATLLERIQIEHGFDELAIVAHSMGGLVSRGAILKYQEETQRDDIRLLVSISTPWGGDVKALRTEAAPIELPPSLKDMSPNSDYLRRLFWKDEARTEPRWLGEETDFHMMFGYRMKKSMPFAYDGVVSVASQTRAEARDRALSRWPYDYDHAKILHASEVVSRLNAILDERFRDGWLSGLD